jgi:adenylate cyclase
VKAELQGRPGWRARLRRVSIRTIDLALAVLITAAGLAVFAYTGIGGSSQAGFAFLQNIELRSLDLRFAVRGARPHDDRIVIVDLDERTLQKLGSYPIPRSAYARLIDRLHAEGARVIALDATFPTPSNNSALAALDQLQKEAGTLSPEVSQRIAAIKAATDQDALFASAMKQAGNVVLGHLFLDAERAKLADPKLEEEYFNVAWGQAYPQIVKVKPKDASHDFDLNKAWVDNHGLVGLGAEANLAKLAEAAASYGFIDINTDPDGTLRHAALIIRYKDQDFFPPLAIQAVRRYEQIPDQEIIVYIAEDGLERIQLGQRLLRPAYDGTQLINYAGPFGTYQHFSMVDVIDAGTPVGAFKDKIVLLGATAKAIGDLRNTPFEGAYMGVEVHANIIDNLLHYGEAGRSFLTRELREEAIDVGFILFFGLVLGVIFSRMRPFLSTLIAVLSLGVFAAIVYFAFAWSGRWLSFVVPAGTLVANYAAITSFRMVFEESEKRKIRKTFSQYLSPGVISLIEQDPGKYIRPGGEMKELSVMFTDIRGFTTLSEGMTPNELVEWLNEYLGAMTDVLFKNYGTLDKYIGDAIMAFWGSPYPQQDHAVRACRCGLEMMQTLDRLNRKWLAEGKREVAMGVGINTGPVNVGNMGSNKRLSWTVMGDNVNLASRLEGLTKEYRVRCILSEATFLQVKDQFVARELDRIRVKGKKQPVKIYELLDTASEATKYSGILSAFDTAMNLYRVQRWREAAAHFGELLARYPEDGPTQIFLQRATEFLEQAPAEGWDGVYVMKTK